MKKIILAATLLVAALGSHAQEQQPNTIQVGGVAKIEREVDTYLVDFTIAVEYGEAESKKSFEDLKKGFFAKVKDAGVDESKFKEDKMAFQALQLFREGSLYTFQTSSREELVKVARLANGNVINVTNTRVKFKPVVRDEKKFAAAFLDAKDKAGIIAKAVNKKLGAVLTVADLTPLEASVEENFYFRPIAEQFLYLSVSFAME
jgi:uncharacterized protein YggE